MELFIKFLQTKRGKHPILKVWIFLIILFEKLASNTLKSWGLKKLPKGNYTVINRKTISAANLFVAVENETRRIYLWGKTQEGKQRFDKIKSNEKACGLDVIHALGSYPLEFWPAYRVKEISDGFVEIKLDAIKLKGSIDCQKFVNLDSYIKDFFTTQVKEAMDRANSSGWTFNYNNS